jgi:hypothetical protein
MCDKPKSAAAHPLGGIPEQEAKSATKEDRVNLLFFPS